MLTFSGPAEPTGEGFVVLDPAGTVRVPSTVDADVDRQIWTLSFDPPNVGGPVGVRWTVQAPDAHPINGAFSFTAPSAPSATPTTVAAKAPVPTTPSPPAPEAQPLTASDAGVIGSAAEVDAIELEAFLAGQDADVAYADDLSTGRRLIGFLGTVLTIGGLAFAGTVLGSSGRDLRMLLTVVVIAAGSIVVGALVELVSSAAVAGPGWGEVLAVDTYRTIASTDLATAIGARAAAGASLVVAVFAVRRRVVPSPVVVEPRQLVTVGAGLDELDRVSFSDVDPWTADDDPSGRSGHVETSVRDHDSMSPWWPLTPVVLALSALLAVSYTFDGHTITEGNRWLTGAADVTHVVAASIWAGGVLAFALVLRARHQRAERLNGLELALRFSTVAGAALVAAGAAGAALTVIIVDDVSQLWSTPWGRLLAAKILAVAAAAAVGAYNHFVVIPWMERHSAADDRSQRIHRTVGVEAALLLVVLSLTALLVGASAQA